MEGLVKCSANYVPLTPISFFERASMVYSDRTSTIYGSVKYTWSQTFNRCLQLASALAQLKISRGDIVAALAPNIPELCELHFAVPMAGAILSPLNIYQDSNMLSAALKLLEAKIIFVDHQYIDIALEAFKTLSTSTTDLPQLVLIQENSNQTQDTTSYYHLSPKYYDYDRLLSLGKNSNFQIIRPEDENDPISVIFTSGTTGTPKAIVHSHRAAYLTTLSEIIENGMKPEPVYLWTVPMYHCNGWCCTWAIAALGGTNICLRTYDAKFIFDKIVEHKVTNLGGATPVLSLIANAPINERKPLPSKVEIMTGGAPPPAQVVLKIEELGFNLTHYYGMSEILGPGTVCPWRQEYNTLPAEERSRIKSLHGFNILSMESIDVRDPVTMQSVPSDWKTIGEVMFRGNSVMKGYYKNSEATKEALRGGWFHTSDVAVRHPDGYIEVKDRRLDVIVAGDKMISSAEVEAVLFSHPAVFTAAVVGQPEEVVGETPCAFVMLKEEWKGKVSREEMVEFCGERLEEYKVPKMVVFGDLPFTSTGKTQKGILRERVKTIER